ncbi:motility associated factor glycosyltransferase family protein [Desulfocurvus sp. DL9XJH121]
MELFKYLEKNLEALEAKGSPVAPWLKGQDSDPNALEKQLVANRHGLLDLPLGENKLLFGDATPQFFYHRWQPTEKAEKSATVLIGCNLGYGLNHVLTTHPPSHGVLVMEPRPEMLAACLALTDYTPFINQGRLRFLPPDEPVLYKALCRLDLQFIYGAVQLRADLPSSQMGPEYAKWSATAKRNMENIAMELVTLRNRQDTMVDNEIANFRQAFANGSINSLEGAAKGLTAVVLGAGPSLAEFGPALAQNPGQAFYATALQTLPAVHAQGLTPHLCMAIDYSQGIQRVFERLDMDWASRIPLIYSTKVQPEVVRRYPGPAIPMWTLGGLATFIIKEREHVIDAGGNVSVALLRFLAWCGAERIVLAGQDFAWKGERSHVAGHHAQTVRRDFDPKRHVRMTNMDGKEVISAMSYVTAQRDMQADVQRMAIPVFNLYGGGLEIKGSVALGLDDLYAENLLDSEEGSLGTFTDALDAARAPRSVPVFKPRLAAWTTSLKSVQKRLYKLFQHSAKRQGEIRGVLNHVLMFLRQDPLYTPYLYNEFMDVAAMAKLGGVHRMQDFVRLKQLFVRVLEKVKHVDDELSVNAKTRAA